MKQSIPVLPFQYLEERFNYPVRLLGVLLFTGMMVHGSLTLYQINCELEIHLFKHKLNHMQILLFCVSR